MGLLVREGYLASPLEGSKKICAEVLFTLLPQHCRYECDGVTENNLVNAAATESITERRLAITKH